MCLSAATYGEAPSSTEFHGRITTSRKTEPTKKIAMRATTDLVARWTARSGSRLSAAAIGDDFRADHGEDHHHDGREDRPDALREESAVRREVGKIQVMPGQESQSECRADDEKDHDRRDFDSGEPEFEFAEG